MKITQEVRDFAAKQNSDSYLAANPVHPEPVEGRSEAEEGMEAMSRAYNEGGRELYIGAGGREHD
jgi:phosphomethylpyrimidine synthase